MSTRSTPGSRNVKGAVRDAQSVWQVLRDPTVPNMWKWLLPIGALLYWIWPLDLIPFLPFDDIAVVIVAMSMFLRMMAQESQKQAQHTQQAQPGPTPSKDDNAIDATWRVVDK